MAIRIQITIVLVIIFQVQGIGPNPLFTILTLDMIAAHNNEHYIALIQHLSHDCSLYISASDFMPNHIILESDLTSFKFKQRATGHRP